jgi:hypothetical protein
MREHRGNKLVKGHDLSTLGCLSIAFALLLPCAARGQVKELETAVIKSTTNLCRKGTVCHRDQAGTWIPKTKVAILSASLAEQSDVDVYVDIEVSTKPTMYMCSGSDAKGCIARAKYSGPGLFDYAATTGSTYLGSNITTTHITFPAGYGIVVEAGVPVYVHLDVRNESLLDVRVDQDIWLYYAPQP